MEIRRLRTLALEIFKTLNDLNPTVMKNIFNFSPRCTHRKHDIFVHPRKTANYGDKSLKSVGPHIWNSLPDEIKATTSLSIFKKFIKNWFGPKCVNCAPFSLTVYGSVYYINFICKNQIINSVYIEEF